MDHRPTKRLLLSLLCLVSTGTATAADPEWMAEARSVAMSVPPKLLDVLKTEIDKSGPEGAIAVCRDEAPKLARAASERTGWQVRRVSLKNRNPKAVPDAWEAAALQDFDRRAAAGESPAKLEHAELVVENGQPTRRYIRALPVLELCVACHGPTDRLTAAVGERLKALYPDDRGTGYGVGQIRGAVTIRKAQ